MTLALPCALYSHPIDVTKAHLWGAFFIGLLVVRLYLLPLPMECNGYFYCFVYSCVGVGCRGLCWGHRVKTVRPLCAHSIFSPSSCLPMAISTSFRKPYQAPRCGRYSLTSSQDLLVAGSHTGRSLESAEYDKDDLPSLGLGEW